MHTGPETSRHSVYETLYRWTGRLAFEVLSYPTCPRGISGSERGRPYVLYPLLPSKWTYGGRSLPRRQKGGWAPHASPKDTPYSLRGPVQTSVVEVPNRRFPLELDPDIDQDYSSKCSDSERSPLYGNFGCDLPTSNLVVHIDTSGVAPLDLGTLSSRHDPESL